MNDYRLGFNSLRAETTDIDLVVKGKIPAWLQGTLIRNGPALFEIDQTPLNHWFDGFAMLHKFSIGNGKVQYSNKFIASQAYSQAMQKHQLVFEEFASRPDYSRMQRLISMITSGLTDNTNVNVIRLGDEYIAMTETTRQLIFDPASLQIKGYWHHNDTIKGQTTTAHPQYDYAHKTLYNFVTQMGPKSYYHIYQLAANAQQRKLLCSIPVKRPAYMHSFAMTERYLIIIEPPLLLSLQKLMFSNCPFIENYDWQPARGTRFLIIDKNTRQKVTECYTEAFFNFHVINAYEANQQELIIDLPIYPDATIIQSLYLQQLKNAPPRSAKCFRFRINLQNQKVTGEALNNEGLELPNIHYANHNGKAYQYFYAAGASGAGEFLNQLIKVDVKNSIANIWHETGCYPGEPVFVAQPPNAAEDEGIILSVVLDAKAKHSFLLILDAQSFHELARVDLPHCIPFGFHGQFWNKT